MAETAIQFLERWRQAHVYAELRALEQLDETVAECIGAAYTIPAHNFGGIAQANAQQIGQPSRVVDVGLAARGVFHV